MDKRGDYREIGNREDRMTEIGELMAKTPLKDYKSQLLLVSSNADRKKYNRLIRDTYLRYDEIRYGQDFPITVHDGEKNVIEMRRFAPKDRIIFTANDKHIGVLNGTMGQIEEIQDDFFIVSTDSGERVTFPIGLYNSIDYGYAVTNYKAQGMGVELVVADMPTSGRGQNRNAAYVDLSRAKQRAIVFTDNKEKLEKQTKAFVKKVSSNDFAQRIRKMVKRGYVANNERYRVPEEPTMSEILSSIKREPLIERPMDFEKWPEREREREREQEPTQAQVQAPEQEDPYQTIQEAATQRRKKGRDRGIGR